MTLNPDEIQAILGALQEAEWDQALVVVDDVTISVSRNGAAPLVGSPGNASPVPSAVPTTVQTTTPEATAPSPPPMPDSAPSSIAPVDGDRRVTAPSVGVLWRSPEPGAPPFVTVGQHVVAGDTLCIVEVMKLMNNVTTDVAGTVTQAPVENGESVEFGSTLFVIRED